MEDEGYIEVPGGKVWYRSVGGGDGTPLFGSSWGGMLAMQYVLDRTPPLRSLILCGSPASIPRWIRECAALLEAEPEAVRATIRDHEARGFTACPEYQSAILGFYRKHVCRLDPWPEGLERSFAEAGLPGIRGAELAIIEDASHLCFAERPAEFATVVNEFLDRIEGDRPREEPG